MKKRTKLSPLEEKEFQNWYVNLAKKMQIDADPDHPLHKYDYRAAYKAGMGPRKDGHWPSQFKDDDHPNRYVNENGFLIDSKKDKVVGYGPGIEYPQRPKNHLLMDSALKNIGKNINLSVVEKDIAKEKKKKRK